ncbi:hypothetical protein [Candidatus Reidiella endopervernicosa]|uniref:Uncharacterized protein n=1 Tax=Candidatus Reidiella endopervernicosa TaxID=2738883 RepID=A0A6N0HWE2_9GAMM|nr:hypothetical protein [Candidatus Reidiella endopervernicosa]QKQ26689.1 hypothetical protein HUE57_10660 [Candidatus Reidiella endopervernicosa]
MAVSEGIESEDLQSLQQQRKKAKHLDTLLNGRIGELLLTNVITREMASSLINDSANAASITKNLVDIATMLYAPKDALVNALDDQNAALYSAKLESEEVDSRK